MDAAEVALQTAKKEDEDAAKAAKEAADKAAASAASAATAATAATTAAATAADAAKIEAEEKQKFAIREGGKTVGAGVVTKIVA